MRKLSRTYRSPIWDGKRVQEALDAHGYTLREVKPGKKNAYHIDKNEAEGKKAKPAGRLWYSIVDDLTVTATLRESSTAGNVLSRVGFKEWVETTYRLHKNDGVDLGTKLTEADFSVDERDGQHGRGFDVRRDDAELGRLNFTENPPAIYVNVDNSVEGNPLYFFMEQYMPPKRPKRKNRRK